MSKAFSQSLDYKTYRVTATATVDVEVPPGEEDRYQFVADKAEDFLYKHAPDIDWVIAEVEDVTIEEPDR